LSKDMVPKRIFLTKGVGKHKERLTSFELALRDAGIAAQNLVRVSSIFPPNCKLITRKEGLTFLSPGEVVFAVVAENSTREPHRLVASSIGLAIPADRSTYGYLSEHHSFGEKEDLAGDYAEELAAEMLATTLDVEFDADKSWDEKKEVYRLSNKIVRTANITQSAVGDKRGLWTTVIAAAILIFEKPARSHASGVSAGTPSGVPSHLTPRGLQPAIISYFRYSLGWGPFSSISRFQMSPSLL
jgi:arginine decarboxylase